MTATDLLASLTNQHTVRLTTYRRNGVPVHTPVNLAIDGDHAYFRTYAESGKAKRLRNNPDVEIVASTVRGKPTGAPFCATAALLTGPEEQRARTLINRRHPFLHRLFVTTYHRLKNLHTQHYRIDPVLPT